MENESCALFMKQNLHNQNLLGSTWRVFLYVKINWAAYYWQETCVHDFAQGTPENMEPSEHSAIQI